MQRCDTVGTYWKTAFWSIRRSSVWEVLDHKSLLEQEEIPLPPLVSLQCPVIKSNNMAAGKGAMFQHHKQGNNGWVWSRKATDL